MNDNEKLYKLYHRNYKNIEELYDDLSDAILNIGLQVSEQIFTKPTMPQVKQILSISFKLL